ncbi:hypothetical protein FACS189483_06510 [Spirochaetia bacterium]|nr:hypothetical protein FACS189483_06510 [Spirochaetia bacterium]
MIGQFFYTLIIFPLVQILDVCYLFVFRVFDNHGIALVGVSLAVSLLTLPLYSIAERWQQLERETQKRLDIKRNKIKAVFKGDEQYMILSAFYQQNHYHPVYALRSSLGLLIQIPFFIAAYSYLSHLEVFQYAGFLFITDLSKPDALIPLGHDAYLNVLPILMTLINIVAGAIYTRGFALREKVQLYGMALVFLLLLYESPSALVLYWTLNNIFSLIKNILQKMKNPKRIVYCAVCICAFLLDIFLLFIHTGYIVKRLFILCLVSLIFFIPLFVKAWNGIRHNTTKSEKAPQDKAWNCPD